MQSGSCTSSTPHRSAPCIWASVCWDVVGGVASDRGGAATAFSTGLVAKDAPCRMAYVHLVHCAILRLVSAPPSAGMVLAHLPRCAQAYVPLVGQRPAPRTAPSRALHMDLRLAGTVGGRLLRSAPGWLDGLGPDAALRDGVCMLVGRRSMARVAPLFSWDGLLFGSSVVR